MQPHTPIQHRRRRLQYQVRHLQWFASVKGALPKPAPGEDPVHPGELLATIYHAFGIDPETIVYNHLNQPRELVKARAVTKLFA